MTEHPKSSAGDFLGEPHRVHTSVESSNGTISPPYDNVSIDGGSPIAAWFIINGTSQSKMDDYSRGTPINDGNTHTTMFTLMPEVVLPHDISPSLEMYTHQLN